MGEHLTCTQKVAGSSPASSTNKEVHVSNKIDVEKIEVEKIVVNVKGQKLELSVIEAVRLKRALEDVLGCNRPYPTIPPYDPVPWSNPYIEPWKSPWYTSDSGSSVIIDGALYIGV